MEVGLKGLTSSGSSETRSCKCKRSILSSLKTCRENANPHPNRKAPREEMLSKLDDSAKKAMEQCFQSYDCTPLPHPVDQATAYPIGVRVRDLGLGLGLGIGLGT